MYLHVLMNVLRLLRKDSALLSVKCMKEIPNAVLHALLHARMLQGMTNAQENVHNMKEIKSVVEVALNSARRELWMKRPYQSADNTEAIQNVTTKTLAHHSADVIQQDQNVRATRKLKDALRLQLLPVPNVKNRLEEVNVPTIVLIMDQEIVVQPAPTFARNLQKKKKITRMKQLTWIA